ncbi:protein P21-like [Canna indica]|uniref:Protein P21-like n=1 Tax=Canna indica TaxID=4628 RepID=A0AAQ3K0K6_9LILI|nr:protein P21-like [Canna indica]
MAASPSSLSLLLLPLLFSLSRAATFDIVNQCSDTIWPAALPGGGVRLDPGQTWSLNVNPGTAGGRIWARTGCNFDGSGSGSCQTGDCGGRLNCQLSGAPPTTLAEFSLNQPNNLDFYDISVIDGFNVPMSFGPTSGGCPNLQCSADVNGQCPSEQRVSGGCNGCNGQMQCSTFFKNLCPDAYTYPSDNTATKSCPSGTNYRVVFCP